MDIVLEIFLLSGLSYLIYTVCMGKNVPYAARRWYLLVSIAASGIIPFVEIPVDTTMAQQVHKALHYAPQGILCRCIHYGNHIYSPDMQNKEKAAGKYGEQISLQRDTGA